MGLGNDSSPTILFAAPSAFPLGGVATWLDYVLPGLASRGWTVQLCLTSGRLHNADAYLQVHPFESVLIARNPTGSREGRIQTLAKLIGTADADIVAAVNLIDVYPAVDRIRARRYRKTRLVKTLHGIQADFCRDIATYRFVLDAVVCTNRLTCKLVEVEGKMEPERIFYAPYGVQIPACFEQPRREGGATLKFAYIGRFDDFQKRIFSLPAIVRELERRQIDFEFLLAGGGPDEVQLREQLAPWMAAGKVQFLGALSGEDLARRIYKTVDALLITSFWETGPLVAWEAMAHGVAVVSAEFIGSGLERALEDGKNCFLFPIGQAQRAADCLAKLLDTNMHEKIASAGRELAGSRYSLDQSVNRWDACFRRILQREARAHSGAAPERRADGRLDRILGTRLGERTRRALKREFRHREPGGEWPHTETTISPSNEEFWTLAKRLDQR